MIRIDLPHHLRILAGVRGKVEVDVEGDATVRSVLDALEARHPVLRGSIREHGGGTRRPFLRFYAAGRDLSHEPPDTLLPEPVVCGAEPFLIVGAIAGG